MDVDQLDLKKLRVFDLVFKYGSLSIASQRLKQTVPAVSQKLKRLEQDLGFELFQRLPNKLVPTVMGHRLHLEVQAIFLQAEQALNRLAKPVVPSGRIVVSIGSDLPWYFVPRISSFLEKYPEVELDMRVDRGPAVVRSVVSGEIHVSFGVFSRIPKTLDSTVFSETALSFVFKPGKIQTRNRPVQYADLVQHRLIVLPRHGATRTAIERVVSANSTKPQGIIEVPNCATAVTFARTGLGVAIVHSICLDRNDLRGVQHANADHIFGRLPLRAIYRRQARSLLIDALLREFEANIQADGL